jgi:metacaspase-1
MARGVSLHIGVNRCNPDHYGGWDRPLSSCENDADTMLAIATARGFEARQLKSEQATRGAVREAISQAADTLRPGDLFVVSYSGHGGQVRDFDGDEQDRKDDTWCLYDGQLLDDELSVLYAGFRERVRVLVLSDSCHSGTMLKRPSQPESATGIEDEFIYSRAMPRQAAIETTRQNRSFYSQIQAELPRPRPEIKAGIRLLSGCQEHEESFGSDECGRFTDAVRHLVGEQQFRGDYPSFHRELVAAVAKAMNPQTPGHAYIGRPDPDYDRQSPFQI